MIGIRSGIDDRNSAAGARIARRIRSRRASHLARGRHQRILAGGTGHDRRLVAGFNHHVPDAIDFPNGIDLTKFHIGGNHIGRQGQIPFHIQGLAIEHLSRNVLGHFGLLPQKSVAVTDSAGILRNRFQIVTGINRGCLIQHD